MNWGNLPGRKNSLNKKSVKSCYYSLSTILIDFFLGANDNKSTGNKIKLVKVATSNVIEVSQPKDLVPPKLLTQKIMNPAINTIEVYTILKPVFLIVALTVASISLL